MHRRRICLDDPQVGRSDEQDGLVRRLKQKSVTGFEIPHLPVIALHRLLCGNEAGLEFCDRLEILADGDKARTASQHEGRVLNGEFEAA